MHNTFTCEAIVHVSGVPTLNVVWCNTSLEWKLKNHTACSALETRTKASVHKTSVRPAGKKYRDHGQPIYIERGKRHRLHRAHVHLRLFLRQRSTSRVSVGRRVAASSAC